MSGSRKGVRALILTVLSLVLLSSLLLVYRGLGRQSLGELAVAADNRLTLFVSNLQGTLSRYDHLPRLLADDRRLLHALEGAHEGLSEDINRYLASVASTTGASDVYLMARDGVTVAASNWNREHSFVGQNFAFRPYFQQAVEGRAGRYYALGTTSLIRGYYFSYPVTRSGEVLGVIVLKIDLADLETAWATQGDHFVVTDTDGIVFLSTEPDWTYRTLLPIDPGRLAEILESRRYAGQEIGTLDLRPLDDISGYRRISLSAPGDNRPRTFLHLTRPMAEAGWDVHMFVGTEAARDSQVLRTSLAAFALLVAVLLVVLYLTNRQRRLVLQDAAEQLEQRVEKRTAELRDEVEERRKAEQSLRETQSELIQAAKMAGLGQMSAGISHELNQPLTAIRNYADNARRLIERGQQEAACGNLAEIGEITERMAAIIAQLRGFSRKSSGEMSRLSLVKAVRQALDLFSRELAEGRIRVDVAVDAGISVRTDPVLFNQVLVNLLSNAIQAMDNSETRRISIAGWKDSNSVSLQISDTGPGIDPAVIENIFDPFFTTKEVGMGLGLGLSISYRIMQSLGGRIEVSNHPDGGACFGLYLPDDG